MHPIGTWSPAGGVPALRLGAPFQSPSPQVANEPVKYLYALKALTKSIWPNQGPDQRHWHELGECHQRWADALRRASLQGLQCTVLRKSQCSRYSTPCRRITHHRLPCEPEGAGVRRGEYITITVFLATQYVRLVAERARLCTRIANLYGRLADCFGQVETSSFACSFGGALHCVNEWQGFCSRSVW